ncbi:MAG TPA: hypothetical protein VKJ45_12550 [Blastocatellia bacterium]|nr:hypothetical protein [Blastocatellia bacterium]
MTQDNWERFGVRDTASVLGYENAPAHMRLKKLYDLIRPEKKDHKIDSSGLFAMAIADQLLNYGCTDEQAVEATFRIWRAVGDDLQADKEPGFAVILRNQREILEPPRYVPSDDFTTIKELFSADGNYRDGRRCTVVIQIDLAALLEEMKERIARFGRHPANYNFEDLKEALTVVCQIKDQVEAAHAEREKK